MQINEGSFRKIFYLNMGSYECKTYLKLFQANFETITICDGKKNKCFFEITSCWKQEGQVPSLNLLVRLYTNLKSLSSKCWEHTLVLDTLKYLFWSFFFNLNSLSVLKETETQPQHLKIETRQSYFSDHLLMKIKTQIQFVRLVLEEIKHGYLTSKA